MSWGEFLARWKSALVPGLTGRETGNSSRRAVFVFLTGVYVEDPVPRLGAHLPKGNPVPLRPRFAPSFALSLLFFLLAGTGAQARNNPRLARRTSFQERLDPRRRAVPRQKLTDFQPGNHFVPRSLSAALPQRRTFWHTSGRNAQIDRAGNFNPVGSFRFHNNRVLRSRRTSFRPRR
jgi:hypothetical protein